MGRRDGVLTKMYPGSDPGLMVGVIIQAAPRRCDELAYDRLVLADSRGLGRVSRRSIVTTVLGWSENRNYDVIYHELPFLSQVFSLLPHKV